MSATPRPPQKIVPAQLGFLGIYNPSLGNTDDTLDDQIVYYSSPETRTKRRRRRRTGAGDQPQSSQEERNDRLRRIGLAQGMVEFGRTFSEGQSVDTIETEKSRIILHELEPGWWLIVSVELTQLPSKNKTDGEETIEYSSREVKPPALLLEDLLRAHSTFLLHHASSMSALFVRSKRPKFCNLLGRYWDSFLSTWNVMLHGNPLVNAYGGIKVAASGELGVGVGEEERGSGERAVLEGFVGRIEGLVDLVVCKFGDSDPITDGANGRVAGTESKQPRPWLGTGAEPTSEDGAVFLGVGALSRKSLRDVTHWMEDVYSWGPRAYGVRDNPTSTRKTRKKTKPTSASDNPISSGPGADDMDAQSPPAVNGTANFGGRSSAEEQPATTSANEADTAVDGSPKSRKISKRPTIRRGASNQSNVSTHSVTGNGGKFVNYLKLGYGTHWTLGGSSTKSTAERDRITEDESPPKPIVQIVTPYNVDKKTASGYDGGSDSSLTPQDESLGHYMIGLMGDIDSDEIVDDKVDISEDEDEAKENHRLLLRTVTVELEREGDARAEADISIDLGQADSERNHSSKHGGSERTGTSQTSFESQDRNKTKKLRIVVYVKRPFMFTFLFELRTDALALYSLYRSLHLELGPLYKPLLSSTRHRPEKPPGIADSPMGKRAPVYDLVWDSKFLTVSSTIPNIPEPPASPHAKDEQSSWTRVEALNTHMQMLNMFAATRSSRSDLEQTYKTSRGWWIVWQRIPDPNAPSTSVSSATNSPRPGARTPMMSRPGLSLRGASSIGTSFVTSSNDRSMVSGPAHPFLDRDNSTPDIIMKQNKEVFLLRRASDYVDSKSSGLLGISSSPGESGWGLGSPVKLAQDIGVDTKRYIEGLLSMGR